MHLNKLTDIGVKAKTKPGRYSDGGGLYLQVSKSKKKECTKAWLFRYMTDGKARQMGLGSVDTFSLKEARERARKQRQLLADGIDPIEHRLAERDARRTKESTRVTFKDAATEYMDAYEKTWTNAKHCQQWRATLGNTYSKLGDRPVSAIDDRLINEAVAPIWMTTPVTASRVKDRIKRVVKWVAEGKPLPQPSKTQGVKHHEALPYAELPEFMAWLRGKTRTSAKALEFTILTAARTGETRKARWGEIDLDAKVWTVPGERTKSRREHRVPLSDRALEILNNMPREKGSKFVFFGSRAKQPLSNMAMLRLLKSKDDGLTVHGFRSAFRDWVAEKTNYRPELAEAALAHVLKDKTEAAYQRGDLLDKRRRLMDAWDNYCTSPPAEKGKVISMHGRA